MFEDKAKSYIKILEALMVINCKAEHASQDNLTVEEAIALALNSFGVNLSDIAVSPFVQLASVLCSKTCRATGEWIGIAGTRRQVTLHQNLLDHSISNLGPSVFELDSHFLGFENGWQHGYLADHIRQEIRTKVGLTMETN